MDTVEKPPIYGLLNSIEGGISNPELLLQVVLIGTVYRLVNGVGLKPGDKATEEGGRNMMKAMHETIKDMVVGEDAQAMMLMACAAAFMGFKQTADAVVKKADATDKAT